MLRRVNIFTKHDRRYAVNRRSSGWKPGGLKPFQADALRKLSKYATTLAGVCSDPSFDTYIYVFHPRKTWTRRTVGLGERQPRVVAANLRSRLGRKVHVSWD